MPLGRCIYHHDYPAYRNDAHVAREMFNAPVRELYDERFGEFYTAARVETARLILEAEYIVDQPVQTDTVH